jgi:hypothetical protein
MCAGRPLGPDSFVTNHVVVQMLIQRRMVQVPKWIQYARKAHASSRAPNEVGHSRVRAHICLDEGNAPDATDN